MLEVDDESRLGRELLAGGARYHAGLVPGDDTIAHMYESAIDSLAGTGLAQYEISNFARPGCESRHNLRYWQRRPYLGLGLDASSMLRESANSARPGYVLRFTNTGRLEVLPRRPAAPETGWLSPERQHEEAWFLGLRLNGGVSVSALRKEFGDQMVDRALVVVESLSERALLTFDGETAHLTAEGLCFERCLPGIPRVRSGGSHGNRTVKTAVHNARYQSSDSSFRIGMRNLPGSNSFSVPRQ